MSILLWNVLPYMAFGSFVVGHIWRYRFDKFGWYATAKRENPTRKLGLVMFRGGLLVLILTRVVDFLVSPDGGGFGGVPAVGLVAQGIGGVATVVAIGGTVILLTRRIANPASPGHTNPVDKMMLPLLGATLATGVAIMFGTAGDIPHSTLFPWFRSLLEFAPRPGIMAHAPAIAQARAELITLLVAIWPYTRLVNVFTAPIGYLLRMHLHLRLPVPRAPKVM